MQRGIRRAGQARSQQIKHARFDRFARLRESATRWQSAPVSSNKQSSTAVASGVKRKIDAFVSERSAEWIRIAAPGSDSFS